ncbi:MAG: hypothetical protein GY928_20665 [Colwellia sp.]|nr:hypothetical protein [Colwellia sp.]
MQFKNVGLKQQFKQIDSRLRVMLSFLDLFTTKKYNDEIVITELIRTQQQQELIYGVGTKKKSVHLYGRGADVRVSNFKDSQITEILDLLNKIPYGKGSYKTAIRHDVDFGDHIHVQVKYYG